jgi:hypothetical protein
VASSNRVHETFIVFQAYCDLVVKRGAHRELNVACAESGLCVPILRAVARQGFGVAGAAWGGRPFP